MDAIHKVVTFFVNPLTVALAGLLIGIGLRWKVKSWSKVASGLTAFSLFWLYLWSTALMTRWIGLPLELAHPPARAETMPTADAICILGGGMGANTNNCIYADMYSGADRVWHGARLYKAGKAPVITLSGGGVRETTVPLLRDFGVPESALVFFDSAKNTEDEAALIAREIKAMKIRGEGDQAMPRILLVTSAWHMRRAEMLFRRAGLDVIPAATDHEVTLHYKDVGFEFSQLVPDAGCLFQNSYLFKEHFAYWCYWALHWVKG